MTYIRIHIPVSSSFYHYYHQSASAEKYCVYCQNILMHNMHTSSCFLLIFLIGFSFSLLASLFLHHPICLHLTCLHLMYLHLTCLCLSSLHLNHQWLHHPFLSLSAYKYNPCSCWFLNTIMKVLLSMIYMPKDH